MEHMRPIGPDTKWSSFRTDYEANFARPISETERSAWEMFARSSDFELLKQTMRHMINGYLLEKEGNSKAAKPGLAEFRDYYDALVRSQKNASSQVPRCEYCGRAGFVTIVVHCSGRILDPAKPEPFSEREIGEVTAPCICEHSKKTWPNVPYQKRQENVRYRFQETQIQSAGSRAREYMNECFRLFEESRETADYAR